MLQIRELTYRIGERMLLDRASAVVSGQAKIGVVGRNGIGKSTLLRLVAGEIEPDDGSVELGRNLRVGKVAQHSPAGQLSPREFVLAADIERSELLAEAVGATSPDRIAEIQLRLADIDAAGAPARAATILAGLGFDERDQHRPLDSFSGGWRMRVALATTLYLKPDLLLLDEPSNHLDLESRIWLENHLMVYRGAILLVSHDRHFLNSVVGSIIHFDSGKLVTYRGNYDRFEAERRKRLETRAAEIRKQADQRRHMQAFVDRFRYKATKARQAQSRLKALARLQDLPPLPTEYSVHIGFPDPEAVPPPLVTLDGVSAGYEPGKPVLGNLDLRLDMDDRIALLGENGNGKTTLLRLLAGEIETMSGSIHRARKLRIGHFVQQMVNSFDPDRTALQELGSVMPGLTDGELRTMLARFGLSRDQADVLTSRLSGGELSRLLFCCVTRDAPHLLLLDEPTNHLDMESRQALIDAINAYRGAVVLVTHDMHLVELCVDNLWVVKDGRCQGFDGDILDYRSMVLKSRQSGRKSPRDRQEPGDGSPSDRVHRHDGAGKRQRRARKRKEVQAAVRRVEQLCQARVRIEERLADPTIYQGPVEEFTILNRQLADLEKRIAAAEADWLAAEEAAS